MFKLGVGLQLFCERTRSHMFSYNCYENRYFMKHLTAAWITAQKMKFSIQDFFSKCDQFRRKLRIWSHLLKESLMGNFIFCAVNAINTPGITFKWTVLFEGPTLWPQNETTFLQSHICEMFFQRFSFSKLWKVKKW